MTIQPAQRQHVPRVNEIAQAAFQPYVAAMGMRPAPMDDDYGLFLERGELYVDLDETQQQVLSFIVLRNDASGLFVETLAVGPGLAGKGLGSKLMRFAQDEAARRGHDRLWLYTNVKMTQNLLWYPKLGYVETHRKTEKGFERVFFEKLL